MPPRPCCAGINELCVLSISAPGSRTFLMAVNKKTGQTVWRHDEPGGDSGEAKPGETPKWIGSWSDPIVRTVNGREELLMSYPGRVCAFDPRTGGEQWTCGGLNPLVYTSPLYSEGVVVGMGGYNGMALAVKTVAAWGMSRKRTGCGAAFENEAAHRLRSDQRRTYLHRRRSGHCRVPRTGHRQNRLGGASPGPGAHRAILVFDGVVRGPALRDQSGRRRLCPESQPAI